MNILRKIIDAVIAVLILGGILVSIVPPVAAERDGPRPYENRKLFVHSPRHTSPSAGRPPYSPPVAIDRAPPLSVRPFAKPFLDSGPSIADRPLAPIGGGAQTTPGGTPFIWCPGGWIRRDVPPYHCPQ
jgi:hypothetical protein